MNQSNSITSLEISESTNKRHSHVLKDVRNLQNNIELKYEKWYYIDVWNRRQVYYRMDLMSALKLVESYNITTTNRGLLIKNINEKLNQIVAIQGQERRELEFKREVINALSVFGINAIPEFYIKPYRIDLYIPSKKLAVEFDEPTHREAKDLPRQLEISRKIQCRFLRIKAEEPIGKSIGMVIKSCINQLH